MTVEAAFHVLGTTELGRYRVEKVEGFGMASWLRYIASYGDLITVLGADPIAGERHYNQFGRNEGRMLNGFDPFAYGASNADLARRFGADEDLLSRHYIEFGASEKRPKMAFDALRYSASNSDLARAYGSDTALLTRHYLEFGAREGRPLAGFDALEYAAANADLARAYGTDEQLLLRHFLDFGMREERAICGFDALRYGASNPDLAIAFGINSSLLVKHYLEFGADEGRATSKFDALNYAAVNIDLAYAYGVDVLSLTRHYLQFGVKEQRQTSGFDSVAYLIDNSDLAGRGVAAALEHWVQNGLREGRRANSFGNDQANHDATAGRVTPDVFELAGDRDWYVLTVTGGQKLSLAILRPELIGAVMTGARLQVFDASGRSLAMSTMTTDGLDNWQSLNVGQGGQIYIAVTGNGTAGAYQLGVARVGADYVPSATPGGGDFFGGAITDVFLGGNGHSIIFGGDGDDILGGGGGQDDFVGGAGADFIDGGSLIGADNTSTDSVSYQASPTGVTVYLDGRAGIGGHAQGDRLLNIEALNGSRFSDTLYASSAGNQINGDAGDDEIQGGRGNDYFLFGGDGNDRIYGNGGSDTLSGGNGADFLDGGEGFDVVDYQGASGVRVDLRSGVTGGDAVGNVLLNIEGVIGSYSGNDILATKATAGYQQLLGYGGNDILIDRSTAENGAFLGGNGGNDLLIGSQTRGDEGDDILVAFRENVINRADGQTGADIYVVETSRHVGTGIFDFSLYIPSFDKSDRIDLSQLRDENSRVLDMADIRAHSRDNIIELTAFKTATGQNVVGYIEVNEQAGLFDPIYRVSTSELVADDFIFNGSVNWRSMVPDDFTIF